MKSALEMSKVSTLASRLLESLDERVFFSKLTGFVQETLGEYKVQAFTTYQDGLTQLIAENGEVIEDGMVYNKGQGLSGYVVRTKRAYYSNSKRDPLLATTKRDECVECEISVPLISNGSILGTIHVQSANAERKFDEADVTLMNELFQSLETPINNMRMYLIAKNLNKELESKIKQKEEELLNRGPAINGTSSSKLGKINLIGQSNSFVEVMNFAKRIAKEDFPVLLRGESGTGKKLLAKKIHSLSDRKDRDCVTVHCSTLNEEQLNLELFGTTDRPGVIQRANGGTVILANIDKVADSIQSKILRLIVSGELYNLDSKIPMAVNVRVISTTKVDLAAKVEEGTFREELLYRLNIMGINMPSLKERREDIKVLAESFINASGQEGKILTSKAIEKLTMYNWPGNIHELKNLMERTAILVSEQFVEESHLPELTVEQIEEEVTVIEEFSEMTLHELEKMHICKTLDHLSGNKTRAAKALGITVKTLYNKLHSYGLVNTKSE